MTTTVKATCPTCGEVAFAPEVVRLRVCRDPRQSFYAFVCPVCSDDVYHRACARHIALLTSGGVPAVVWDVPDELLEGPHPGPPISYDDLLDFALAIEAHDAGAAASDQPQPPCSAIARLTAAFRPLTP